MISYACTPPLFVSIKGEAGSILGGRDPVEHNTQQITPILALASINSSSNRDLGASLPLSPRLYPLLQAPPVQDSTVPSHTPLLDVRPHGRNQDKPVCCCIASCIAVLPLASTFGTSNAQHHHWLSPDRRVRAPTGCKTIKDLVPAVQQVN